MRIVWTRQASDDLVRLHAFLAPVAPEAAANVVQSLARAPERLVDFPQLAEKLDAYAPRDVRRLFVGRYEMRYEIAEQTIFVLRCGMLVNIGRATITRPESICRLALAACNQTLATR